MALKLKKHDIITMHDIDNNEAWKFIVKHVFDNNNEYEIKALEKFQYMEKGETLLIHIYEDDDNELYCADFPDYIITINGKE